MSRILTYILVLATGALGLRVNAAGHSAIDRARSIIFWGRDTKFVAEGALKESVNILPSNVSKNRQLSGE